MLLQREPKKKKKKNRGFIRDNSDGFRYEKCELYDDQNPHAQTVTEYFHIVYARGMACSRS